MAAKLGVGPVSERAKTSARLFAKESPRGRALNGFAVSSIDDMLELSKVRWLVPCVRRLVAECCDEGGGDAAEAMPRKRVSTVP